MIKTVLNVEAPRQQVFSILTDYPRYKDWLPGCESSRVVSTTASSTDTEIVIASMKKMTLGLRFEAGSDQVLSFRMTSGKDLKAYSGSYRLMEAADGRGTVLISEMEIDAGAMVPRFMVDRMAKKSIDDTGNALKKHIRAMPAPAVAPAAKPAAPAAAAPRARRAKRIVQVVRTEQGYRLWLMGQTYAVPAHPK